MVPSAREMAEAISIIVNKLLIAEVLDQASVTTLERLKSSLLDQRESKKWKFSVDRDEGFIFQALADKKKNIFIPVVSVDCISVDESIMGRPPINRLDVSLELRYCHADENIFRWHFDQANITNNRAQPGPLYHLQFGGHAHEDRSKDMPISEPRWAHPPMDLVLLLEAVTANFFPAAWEDLRDDREWCGKIQVAQRFCLQHYYDKLGQHLREPSGTMLSNFWADRWAMDNT